MFFAFICLSLNAQTDKGFIRHGNNDFKKGNYSEAEVNYRKSLDKEYNPKAEFNLGDALYEQKNYENAAQAFTGVTERNTSKEVEASAYYNLGNTQMAQEKYAEAFNSYKKSLEINPNDEDAIYNLNYARMKMIQQQQQQNQEQEQKQDQQQQQQQQQQMSKEDAERMLQALENQEKKTMDEINEKKASQMQKRKSQKDW